MKKAHYSGLAIGVIALGLAIAHQQNESSPIRWQSSGLAALSSSENDRYTVRKRRLVSGKPKTPVKTMRFDEVLARYSQQ